MLSGECADGFRRGVAEKLQFFRRDEVQILEVLQRAIVESKGDERSVFGVHENPIVKVRLLRARQKSHAGFTTKPSQTTRVLVISRKGGEEDSRDAIVLAMSVLLQLGRTNDAILCAKDLDLDEAAILGHGPALQTGEENKGSAFDLFRISPLIAVPIAAPGAGRPEGPDYLAMCLNCRIDAPRSDGTGIDVQPKEDVFTRFRRRRVDVVVQSELGL